LIVIGDKPSKTSTNPVCKIYGMQELEVSLGTIGLVLNGLPGRKIMRSR